jgi:A/G-specific adenine glycosylase
MTDFSSRIIQWQQIHGRHDLPWQHPYTAYRVWLSEIMLQQTQVKTVIVYYQRFLDRCPDVKSLSLLSEDELMVLWQGLGYYSRARNLHKAARMVVNEFGGVFPKSKEGLLSLPGIGPSTASAILSLAYEVPAAILDGNVKRVLARHFGITGDINTSATQKLLWQYAEHNLPTDHARIYTQGLMDLGATICKPKSPLCQHCPLIRSCQAYQQNLTDVIPHKRSKVKVKDKALYVIIHTKQGKIGLLKKQSGIWNKLYTPRILDSKPNKPGDYLGKYKHQLTHLKLTIHVYVSHMTHASITHWVDAANHTHAIPTGIKPALELYRKSFEYSE